MGNTYLWVKIVHIAFVVAWMAVLLYLPRIFVYHANVKNFSETSDIFKVMERRLYYYIGHPSALLVWVSGLYMAYALGFYGWLIAKFFEVFLRKKASPRIKNLYYVCTSVNLVFNM